MRCGMHPACTGRKTGGVFVTGREQKACPFSESGGRYISPRPSSFVPRRAGTKCPKGGGSRSPKIQKGGQAPLGLARLDDRKARPGGAVNGGALVRRSSRPLTAPAGFATPPPLLLPLALVGLPPRRERRVLRREGGFDRRSHYRCTGFSSKWSNTKYFRVYS